ncbi:MAG: winged helix-turn-helix domain-containing protein [Phycisphaerae bacterium]|nr:winged helix-turn-helix domain-containing protein [Phycisphaerae bacterium]
MNDTIGQAAGQIWHLLANSAEPVNITDIPKKTKLTAQIAYQGLGWLACEHKVNYIQKGRSILISLK